MYNFKISKNSSKILYIILGPFLYGLGLILSIFFGTYESSFVEQRYVGVSGVTEELNSEGDGTITNYKNSFVFNKNDRELLKEVDKVEEEFNEGSSQENFIFWQTALAKGFLPKNINQYNGSKTFSQKLELYLTVGPLTIAENLIKATIPSFSLLIFPFIGILFKKRWFYKDLDALRNHYLELNKYEK